MTSSLDTRRVEALGEWCLAHHAQVEALQDKLSAVLDEVRRVNDRLDYLEEAVAALLDGEQAERQIRWVLGQRWAWLNFRRTPAAAALVWWYVQYRIHGPAEELYEPMPEGLLISKKRVADLELPPSRTPKRRLATSPWETSG